MQTIVLGTPSAERSLSSVVGSSAHEEIEIVSADGSVIAHLVPALDVSDEIYQRVAEEYRQDAAELQRRLANRTPGRTTAEVMERLQRLADSPCDSQ